MWRHLPVGLSVLVLSVAGCGTERLNLAAARTDGAAVSRLQKPDGEGIQPAAARVLLNVPPDLADPSRGRVTASIRATVNNIPILDEEVRDASFPYLMELRSLPEPERSARMAEVFNRELERLIEREVILQDAFARLNRGGKKYLDKLREAAGREFDRQVRSMKQRANVKSDEELKDVLRSQGLALDGMRRQFERTFIAMQYMRSRMEAAVDRAVTHDRVVEYYRNHPEEFQVQDSVQWQDIFIDAGKHPDRQAARRFADDLIRRAKGGEAFEQFFQHDNGDSRYRNGDGIGRRRGEIRPPECEAALFAMKDGEVGPVVELTNGFHVFRLVKREMAGTMPLDEKTQTRIKDKLRDEATNREYKKTLADLKRGVVVEYAKGAP